MNRAIEHMLLSAKRGKSVNASEFLEEVLSGAPIDDVVHLLESENDFLASEGAWILSEVGASARHLLSMFPGMAMHSDFKVRYWAIDYAVTVLCERDAEYVPCVLKLLLDPDLRVRAHAIILFRNLEREIFCNFVRHEDLKSGEADYLPMARAACNVCKSDIILGLHSNVVGIRSVSIMKALLDDELMQHIKSLAENDIGDDIAFVLNQFSAFAPSRPNDPVGAKMAKLKNN